MFSHDYPTLVHIINDHLQRFRLADLDPEVAVEPRGLDGVALALPFWTDQLALWQITLDYAEAYVGHYYADGTSVTANPDLCRWMAKRSITFCPSGLYDEHGCLGAGAPLIRPLLARVVTRQSCTSRRQLTTSSTTPSGTTRR